MKYGAGSLAPENRAALDQPVHGSGRDGGDPEGSRVPVGRAGFHVSITHLQQPNLVAGRAFVSAYLVVPLSKLGASLAGSVLFGRRGPYWTHRRLSESVGAGG